MAQLTWDALNPADTSRYLDAIQKAQAQTLAGIDQIGNAYKGYNDNLKKQNTNDMLTALNQARNPEELAIAQANIAAMQDRWGSGYDMDAVRTAMDERPTVLMQRQSAEMDFKDKQANLAARPDVAAIHMAQLKSLGASDEQLARIQSMADSGVDTTAIADSFGQFLTNDRNFTNENFWKQKNFNQNAYQFEKNFNQGAYEFDQSNNRANNESAWRMGKDAFEADQASGAGTTYVAADGTEYTTGGSGGASIANYASMFGPLAGVRGIRNNNPGNLNFAGQRGATRENGKGRFAAFNTPEEGLHAMSRQLDLHFNGTSAASKKAGRPLQSIADIVSAWAPPSENDTKLYIAQVAKELGVSPTAKLNLKDPTTKMALMQSIVKKENGGNPYTQEQYIAGIGGNTASNTPATAPLVGIDRKVQQKIRGEYQEAMLKYNEALALKDQPVNVGNVLAGLTAKEEGSFWTQDAFDIVNALKDNPQLAGLSAEGITNVYNRAKAWQAKPKVPLIGYNSSAGLKGSIDNFIKDELNNDIKRKEHVAKASHPSNTFAQRIQQEFEAKGVSISAKEALLHIDPQRYESLYGKPTVKVQEAVEKKVEKVAATATPAAKAATTTTATAATAAVAAAAKPKPAAKPESKKTAETLKQDFKPKPTPRPYDNLVLNFPDSKTKAEFAKKVEAAEKQAAQARKAADAAKRAQKLREEAVEKRRVADILVKRAREEAARKAAEEARRAKFRQEREARLNPPPSDEWLKSAKERLKQK